MKTFLWRSLYSTCMLMRHWLFPERHTDNEFFCARILWPVRHNKDVVIRLDNSNLHLEQVALKLEKTRYPPRSTNSTDCWYEQYNLRPRTEHPGCLSYATVLGESACAWAGAGVVYRVSQTWFSESVSQTWRFIIHIWGNVFLFPVYIRNANIPR